MKRQRHQTLTGRRRYHGFLFVLPWFIGFLLFFLYPLGHSFIMSLNKIDLKPTGYEMNFSGLTNFTTALTEDAYFSKYMVQSVVDLIINVPIVMVFSFFAAVLLKQKFHGNTIVKVIFFLPVILGAGVFLSYQGDAMGVQNVTIEAAKEEGVASIGLLQSFDITTVLHNIGLSDMMISYIVEPIGRIYSVISQSGVQIFIFLAALNSIAPSLYEASYMEGASGWETFWKITFPMVSPMILVNFVYSIVDTFTAANNVTMNYIKDMAFANFDMGLSSAMSWIFCFILIAIIGIVSYFVSKRVFYNV